MEGGVEVDGCGEETLTKSIQTLKGSRMGRGKNLQLFCCYLL
jgi:hypothetical protein